MEDRIRANVTSGEMLLIDRMTSHLGRNPNKGGIPARDRKFRAVIEDS